MSLNLPFIYHFLANITIDTGEKITALIEMNKRPGDTVQVFGYVQELDDFKKISDGDIVAQITNLKLKQ